MQRAPIAPRWAIALALAAATFVVYAPVRHHAFIVYDDRGYLFENAFVARGLTPAGVAWAFTTFYFDNWHPLTWLSHMLDCELFGLDAGAHHVVNVMWHAANSVLLLWLLDRMTGAPWRSGLVAALFALHPIHVESVAWVAERKDLLSTFFGLVCIAIYRDWTRRGASAAYALALVSFALSLMSKPMLVTLPAVLLLLDFWPLARASSVSPARLVLEKLPFFALSAASSVVTYRAQMFGGEITSTEELPIALRLANAVVSYVDYLGMMIWPADLAVIYPYPEHVPGVRVIAAAVVLAVVSAAALALARRRPSLAVGWLWYLGTLVPVIGLVQVGVQAKADRYTYFPSIGIFLMLAWSLPSLRARRPWRAIAVGCALLALVACAWRTRVEVGYWRDSITLFDRALAVTRANFTAHSARGFALATERRQLDAAIADYREALRINPRYATARSQLAGALAEKGDLIEAVDVYRSLLEQSPRLVYDQQNLAVVFVRLGRPAEAIPHFEAALAIRPNLRASQIGLASALEQAGRGAEAIGAFERAIATRPRDAELRVLIAEALARAGRFDEAVPRLEEALRLRPDYPEASAALDRVRRERASAARAEPTPR